MKRIDNLALNLTNKTSEEQSREIRKVKKRVADEIASQSAQLRNKRGQGRTSQAVSSAPAPNPDSDKEEGEENQEQRVKPKRRSKSDKRQKKEPLGGIFDNPDDESDSTWTASTTPVEDNDGLENVDYDEEGISDHDNPIDNLRIGRKKVDNATIVSTWRASTVERLDASQVDVGT